MWSGWPDRLCRRWPCRLRLVMRRRRRFATSPVGSTRKDSRPERNSSALASARPHAAADFARDVAAVVGPPEIAGEHAHRLAEENRVGQRGAAGCGRIPDQRLVVAALHLPFLDRFRRHALDAELHARHVVRRIDHEEQAEGEQIDADQERNRIQQAAD